MTETARLLNDALAARRWRSADLAASLDVSAVTAWSWTTGRLLPSDAVRPRLCRLLSIDTAALAEACAADDAARKTPKE